ncbi:UNVERIFIED_CONTAM: hypothetical protein Sradi_2201600 [Sesamum radiatum]|uniref:Uncharacterized protein n=1 Tax=Sesamum radiatum TaxID=300843 RepID=A0AAW2T352_SESRA
MVQPIATGTFFLGFALACLHFFISALGELRTRVVGIESPPWIEFGAIRIVMVRFSGCVDKAEGRVLVGGEGCEGVVTGEIECRIGRVVSALFGPGLPGLESALVQSAIRPSLSEREKGAKGTLEGWLGTESVAAVESGGPQPSG